MKEQFVYFGTSSEWLKAIDKDKPVNAECMTEFGKGGKYGIRLASQEIVLSQINGSEVLCFMDVISRYQTMDVHPMSPKEQDDHARYSQSAYIVTTEWLSRNGVTNIRRAMVATPANIRKLEGAAEYMGFNKESGAYFLRDES